MAGCNATCILHTCRLGALQSCWYAHQLASGARTDTMHVARRATTVMSWHTRCLWTAYSRIIQACVKSCDEQHGTDSLANSVKAIQAVENGTPYSSVHVRQASNYCDNIQMYQR